jgi:putative SOS response-associated peptidase YedK
VGAIKSERRAVSDRNRWAPYVRNRSLPSTRRALPAFFAGIWTRRTWVRKMKGGETTNDLFRFLTTEPNREVGALHPKAMPVVLRTVEEIDLWLTAPAPEALALQKPLPDGTLTIVARGLKQDGVSESERASTTEPFGLTQGTR